MKTTISGIIAAIFGLLTIIATVPTALQEMLMRQMPTAWQPYTALIFATAGFIAKAYQAKNTQDTLKAAPAQTTTTPATVSRETTATLTPPAPPVTPAP